MKTHRLLPIALLALFFSGTSTVLGEPLDNPVNIGDVLRQAHQNAEVLSDDWQQVRTFRDIANVQHRAGDGATAADILKEALQRAEQMSPPGRQIAAFRDIALAQASAGDRTAAEITLTKAQEAAQGIDRPFLRIISMKDIGQAQATIGDRTAAEITLEKALDEAESIDPPEQRATALQLLAAAHAGVGNSHRAAILFQQALEIILPMKDDARKSGLLQDLALSQAYAGWRDDAEWTLNFARQAADADPNPEAQLYATVLIHKSQAKLHTIGGNPPAAREALNDARRIAGQFAGESDRKWAALQAVAIAQAEAGDLTEALQTAAEIPKETFQIPILPAIATAQARAGEIETALRTAQNLPDGSSLKSAALRNIALAQVSKGDSEGALQTSEGITHETLKASILPTLASSQVKVKPPKQVVDWSEGQESPLTRSHALIGVAQGMLGQ